MALLVYLDKNVTDASDIDLADVGSREFQCI